MFVADASHSRSVVPDIMSNDTAELDYQVVLIHCRTETDPRKLVKSWVDSPGQTPYKWEDVASFLLELPEDEVKFVVEDLLVPNSIPKDSWSSRDFYTVPYVMAYISQTRATELMLLHDSIQCVTFKDGKKRLRAVR